MKKIKLISILIAIILIAELLPPAAFETKASGGYYEITDVKGLKSIKDDLSGTYILKNDIDMGWDLWEPIGSEEHPFTGRFEGNGHVIYGIEVEALAQEGNALAGFFGYTAHAVISDLSIMDASILAFTFNTSENRCFASAGGIAGSINDNTVIDRCCFYGTIEAEGRDVNYARTGGIVAGVHSGSVITDCFACADLTCSSGTANAMAGGICAWISGSTVERCYFDGDITVPDDCYTYAGGINASGNKDGRVEGCMSIADAITLSASQTDHCVYNPVGCFAGDYSNNAYSGGIFSLTQEYGDSDSIRIDINDLSEKSVYERLGWIFDPDNWIDTYRYPRLAGVGRRIIIGEDTPSFGNYGGIDYEHYFDVISDETDLEPAEIRANMSRGDGLCFGICALTEVLLNDDIDVFGSSDMISGINPDEVAISGLSTWQFIRYLHVMQYDDDYDDYYTDTSYAMQTVFDAVKAYADGYSDEVPILKVKSEALWINFGHAIIGIDYNDYDDCTEIICYDPNFPGQDRILYLYKDDNGDYEYWDYRFWGLAVLSSTKPKNLIKYYDTSSRIYDDLMEERSVFMTRQEVIDRYGENN